LEEQLAAIDREHKRLANESPEVVDGAFAPPCMRLAPLRST
jgi:hypothetical protein